MKNRESLGNSILDEIKIFMKQLFCFHRYAKISVNAKIECCCNCRKYFKKRNYKNE